MRFFLVIVLVVIPEAMSGQISRPSPGEVVMQGEELTIQWNDRSLQPRSVRFWSVNAATWQLVDHWTVSDVQTIKVEVLSSQSQGEYRVSVQFANGVDLLSSGYFVVKSKPRDFLLQDEPTYSSIFPSIQVVVHGDNIVLRGVDSLVGLSLVNVLGKTVADFSSLLKSSEIHIQISADVSRGWYFLVGRTADSTSHVLKLLPL